jgi:2-oxoglutarate ferredoxin oxidoreductase subunit beta
MSETLKPGDFKTDIKPIWCPGCGDYAILSALTKSMAYLGLAREQVGLISGIGCSSRLPAYIDSYGFHGVHGRALAVAQGLKAARPDLTVIAAGGDGDGFSIGGNHFLHACRRNMDLTYIVMDNHVYGMTKGQPSPTTEPDWISKLTPHGSGLRPFNPLAIALSSGASYIARGFAGDPSTLSKLIVEGIQHRGFAFIEVLSPCPTFRPEQKQWKKSVQKWQYETTDDPVEAASRIHGDNGMSTGLIYQHELPIWEPSRDVSSTVDAIEEDFQI